MKPLYLIAASTLALTTAACGTGEPKARAALDCPATQGELTRTGASADGKSCTYVSSEGAEVKLQLVSVQGGPDATLTALENTLLAELPAPAAASAEGAKADAAAKVPQATAEAKASSAKSASQAAREAAQDTASVDVDVDVDVDNDGPKRVEVARGTVIVDEKDGTTHVNLPGIHIDADDVNDRARVRVGPIRIDANADGMTFRSQRDVRLRGEQLSREKRGIRATFIAERKGLPEGSRFVAFEAGGPKVGPLTVATVRSNEEINDGDRVYKDIKRLVRDNGGV